MYGKNVNNGYRLLVLVATIIISSSPVSNAVNPATVKLEYKNQWLKVVFNINKKGFKVYLVSLYSCLFYNLFALGFAFLVYILSLLNPFDWIISHHALF